MDSNDKFLRNKCKQFDVDYALAKKLKTRVFPLLEEAHRQGYQFDKAFLEKRKGTEIRLANSAMIQQILGKLDPKVFSRRERGIIALHLEYLSLFEGYYAPQVNFLVFSLIQNGHALHSPFHRKNVKKLDEIEEVRFSLKLKFLRKHGFAIVANKSNTRLRNSVAHLFYYVDDDGTIRYDNLEITKDEYEELYDKLRNVSFGLHLVTLTFYRRFA